MRTPRLSFLGALALLPALCCGALLPATSLLAQQPSAAAPEARQQLRERILGIAREYAEFEWQGQARNVLHGPDANGTQVDTPDISFDQRGFPVDGGAHHGMPYAWGGFTSIDEFREGLQAGLPAGNVPTSERAQTSAFALGLDCSGYVARCWELPVKQSTRSLGALCYPLPGYDALQPADILNRFDSHVVIFDHWVDEEHGKLSVWEAGRLGVVASEYAAETLKRQGFEPMRYRPLDERWVSMAVGAPEFSARTAGAAGAASSAASAGSAAGAQPDAPGGRWIPEDPSDAAPPTLAELPSPLRDAQPHEWARYAVTKGSGPEASARERLSLVATAQGPLVEIQTDTVLPEGTLSTGTAVEHADVFLDALLDFAASDDALSGIEVGACTLTRGHYELGGRSFPAVRIEARLDAKRVMRHQDYPVTLTVDCIVSPEVPVHGILEAQVTEETVWRTEPTEQRSVWVSRYNLLEFCGAW